MNRFSIALIFLSLFTACSQRTINSHQLLSREVHQFDKAEFSVVVNDTFKNPHDQREVMLDMVLTAPSGKKLRLPCYHESNQKETSMWKARFTPQETGKYEYSFELTRGNGKEKSEEQNFESLASNEKGFLHINDFWTLKFDNGSLFRGIGENVGWESRSFEDDKWTYDHLLPTLSANGANFFRTWMCVWNLPVAWNKVNDTKRYQDASGYFNESGIKRFDELVAMSDSLGLYFMLSIDAHGALLENGQWNLNPHNKVNGGPAGSPGEFFSNEESKAMYRNRLRYIVARWGYSPAIAAWEFFNEIDNAVFTPTPHDSVLIDHSIITGWHDEMSTYLKSIDPYDHIVTTSISHRDIKGMNDLPNIDLNQKHIYNKTHLLSPTIHEYAKRHNKPYVIGEFGYDWNWDNVKHEIGPEFDHDYKRGLWYGLFSPTPILPMTWWWEFFDERNMTPYFNGVRLINDRMMKVGNGSFEIIPIQASGLDAYAVKCKKETYIYLLNNTQIPVSTTADVKTLRKGTYKIEAFNTATQTYSGIGNVEVATDFSHKVTLAPREDTILILSELNDVAVTP
jgi:hypothetical protein